LSLFKSAIIKYILITEIIFQSFLECETKSYLKFLGSDIHQPELAGWQSYIAEEFNQECFQHLRSIFREAECLIGRLPTKDSEIDKYKLVLDCIVQAKEIRSRLHALERSAFNAKPRYSPYIPIRFVPKEKITKHDKLLLAFDALALSLASGKMPPFGKIIHGCRQKMVRINLAGLMKTTRSIVKTIAAQQPSDTPPRLILNKHCAECEYQPRCKQIALEKDDLSLLSSMSVAEIKKQQDKGIFTVTQLSYTFRPRRRSKHSASEPEKYHHALKALAIREQKIYVAGRPELNIAGTPIYLDVEGVPDRDYYYLIGVRIKNGGIYNQHSFWANGKSEEKEIWHSLLRTLAKVESPQLIHYGSYETVFLKRMRDRYGEDGENPTFVERLIAQSVNLLSIIYAQIYFPTYSNGLKEIARHLGFQWSDEAASGASALMWRSKWEYAADPELKQKLITYNAEDCTALERVTEAVTRLCLNRNEPNRPRNDNTIHTDSLMRRSVYHWGRRISQSLSLRKSTSPLTGITSAIRFMSDQIHA
jgi:predicted RecB family nuclease